MFYIRKRSIIYGHADAFTAHLLQSGTDVHMGMVENSGYGVDTTFEGVTPCIDGIVQVVAEHFEITVDMLMYYYIDIAEGVKGRTPEDRRLIAAIASYKPE